MTTANASCSLNIAPTTIAAWRDGALSSDESARIAAHVSDCAACRQEIALYESLDDALRRQPVPESDGRLWRAVRAGMADNRRRHASRRTMRRVVSATSALAAVLLLALGFAQLFQLRDDVSNHPRATATATTIQGTPSPIPTAVPPSPAVRGASPNWQPANFPTSGITFGDRSTDILTFGVAATDGATAYACYSQTDHAGSLVRIYHTSDRAVHWAQRARFSLPSVQVSECIVQVDALDANRVLVAIWGGNLQTQQEVRFYELTEDGGATWTKLPYSDLLYGIATVGGRTYALRDQVVGKQSDGLPKFEHHLSVSTDHLRSWQPIDTKLIAVGQGVSWFWLNPDGELLVTAVAIPAAQEGTPTPLPGQVVYNSTPFWQSGDGGAHWNVLPPPILSGNVSMGAWAVQQPIEHGQSWRLCFNEMSSDSRSAMGIVCTFDGGHTWAARPYLCTSAPCSAEGPIGYIEFGETLAADGSVLLIAPDKSMRLGLYRLPAHSSQWEYLGSVNGSNALVYAPISTGGGVIWLYAGGGSPSNLSGSIGSHLGSLPNVLLSTAIYP